MGTNGAITVSLHHENEYLNRHKRPQIRSMTLSFLPEKV